MNDTTLEPSCYIYEVNLTIEKDIFEKNKEWLLSHFNDMVNENNFIKGDIYYEINFNPLNDSHFTCQRVVAKYLVEKKAELVSYLEKQATKMRSQVVERLRCHYSVNRRILKHVNTFHKAAR